MDMMVEIDQQMLAQPSWVKMWMNWMMFIFFAGAIFAWWKTTARWALGAMLATMPTAMVIFHFTGNVHLFGLAHIIFWLPLAILIWKKDFRDGIIPIKGFYHTWLLLLFTTITISLIFDVRDIFLVAMGSK